MCMSMYFTKDYLHLREQAVKSVSAKFYYFTREASYWAARAQVRRTNAKDLDIMNETRFCVN